jgi:hypothetical protein
VSNFEESERISEKLVQLLSFRESRLSALRAGWRLKSSTLILLNSLKKGAGYGLLGPPIFDDFEKLRINL